ncbi:retrovirus-related pol polyprotein from transposon TNT 1-94 [Tanacetum coccineum]
MLTKPQVFYGKAHKQALGYQNPFYLKKVQRIKPTLYDGSVISDKHVASPVFDDEETLILEEVSRSKMLAKQNDPILKEKKVNTTPINYAELNRLSEDFDKLFVPQQELSDEQAFWLQTSHPNTDQSASSPVKIEAPRELPKITPDAITEGEWGFEHTKIVFLNEIIPFLKNLKDIFIVFDKDLLNKEHIKSMRENDKEENVKHEMDEIKTINIELEHSVEKLLYENERLHKEIKHLKKIYKDQFDSIKKTCALSKEHGDSLIAQLNSKSMENLDLKLQDKVFMITSLKNDLRKLKGKETVENAAQIPIATTVAPCMLKLDLDPLALRLLQNWEAHIYYLKHTQEQADILLGIVEQAKAKHTIDNVLNLAFLTPKPEIKVYSRRPKQMKLVGSSKKAKIVESKITNNSEPNHLWGSNATDVSSSSSLINDRLSRSFSDLEVAFWKNTCFIRNLEGVDLFFGSRDTNLYTISLDDMLKTSSICIISKSSNTKSWLWRRQLSHINFGTLNKLAKDGLARGIPKHKFQKDHLCMCLRKKQEILTLRPRLFLRLKDEYPDAIIKCIKNIQVCLNATVRNVRTDNGTEFVNQTLRDFYENVSISHQTSVAHTPQQNGVVERRNRTIVEADRTMLIFLKAPLFLWAEAINTACYTQNRSLIHLCYNKNPYELMHKKKPDLSFLHVFGSLCYPTNDSDDLGKLNAKADIGIFVR